MYSTYYRISSNGDWVAISFAGVGTAPPKLTIVPPYIDVIIMSTAAALEWSIKWHIDPISFLNLSNTL